MKASDFDQVAHLMRMLRDIKAVYEDCVLNRTLYDNRLVEVSITPLSGVRGGGKVYKISLSETAFGRMITEQMDAVIKLLEERGVIFDKQESKGESDAR